jgi:hypothetical protein
MKIDRFVKVMLVLIVVFLALNFFNNFSNSFDPQGNRFRFENIVDAQAANRTNGSTAANSKRPDNTSMPASRTQYIATSGLNALNDAATVQRNLDAYQEAGWEYVGSIEMVMIFKK